VEVARGASSSIDRVGRPRVRIQKTASAKKLVVKPLKVATKKAAAVAAGGRVMLAGEKGESGRYHGSN